MPRRLTTQELLLLDKLVNHRSASVQQLAALTTQLKIASDAGDRVAYRLVHEMTRKARRECKELEIAVRVLRAVLEERPIQESGDENRESPFETGSWSA